VPFPGAGSDPTPDPLGCGREPTTDTDSDGDGLSDGAEITLGTDPRAADTDRDGLADGDEAARGTDPRAADTDEDGLADGKEVKGGTDPKDSDTDGDGLQDGEEAADLGTDPLSSDSDGDGLSDRDEVRMHETDPTCADSDADALPDGDEISKHGTDPLSTDSDADGLSDGAEVKTHKTDPLDADTDGDGLEDGAEIAVGSSPLDEDSDDDGAIDGWDPAPLLRDADGDGIIDGREASNFSASIEAEEADSHGAAFPDFLAKGGMAVAGQAGLLAEHTFAVRAGTYRVFARARGAAAASFQIEVRQKTTRIHAHTYFAAAGYRWHSTVAFAVEEGEISVRVAGVSASSVIDRILLVHAPAVNAPVTDPRDRDTDGDGLADGPETRNEAHWFEAEHFACDPSQVRAAVEASNSEDIFPQAPIIATGPMAVLRIADPRALYGAGPWTVFVRAKSDTKNLANQLVIRIRVGGVAVANWNVSLVVVVGKDPAGNPIHQNFYDWFPGPAFFVQKPEDTIDIEVLATGNRAEIHVDEVLLLRVFFEAQSSSYVANDPGQPPVQVSSPVQVPNAVTSPMDRDTDGDGFRPNDGVLAGSSGELTDEHERSLGMNGLDADTDGDGRDDATDPNPLSADSDGDGLLDAREDSNLNNLYDPARGETDWLDADTDGDGISDGNEDVNRNGSVDPRETDPRKSDTDGDGLSDGDEYRRGTDPIDRESDGDGLDDGAEVSRYETDPADADTDGDGLSDGDEIARGTDPKDRDSDGDGLEDGEEVERYDTDPKDFDTDGDGLSDGEEVEEFGSDPKKAHSDGDGIKDGEEVKDGTDPTKTDTDGDGDPDNTDRFPTNLPPQVDAGIDKRGLTGEEIVFQGFAYDPDGVVLFSKYVWSFGDGGSAIGAIVSHVYAQAGSFRVTLTATDDAGESASDSVSATIEKPNRPPVADAGPDSSAKAGQSVSFNGSGSKDSDGWIASYSWEFNDRGATATGSKPSHTFQDAGTYYVKLTVKDDDGATASDTVVVTVDVLRPADLVVTGSDISVTPSYPKDGDTLSIRATIRNQGEVGATGVGVEVFDEHPDGSTYALARSTGFSVAAGGSSVVTAAVGGALRGTHTIRVRIDAGSNNQSNGSNDEATRTVEVEPASTTAHYLGYKKEYTTTGGGDGGHKTSDHWLEPAWHWQWRSASNSIWAETTAGFATGGGTWAQIWTESFEIRETTKLKAAAVTQLETTLAGGFRFALSAFVGIIGSASARTEIDMYLEKYDSASSKWRQVSTKELADERESEGEASYGVGIGGSYEDPYRDGYEETATQSSVKGGELYRVRLRMKCTAHAGGNCGSSADGYYSDRKAWWDKLTVISW